MTQNEPLDVEEFIGEAQKRGFHLRTATLRELYRYRLLMLFIQITNRPARGPAKPAKVESPLRGYLPHRSAVGTRHRSAS
jgi:hypothetical protein